MHKHADLVSNTQEVQCDTAQSIPFSLRSMVVGRGEKLIYLINPAAAEFLRCYKPVIFPTRPGSLSMWAHSYWFQVTKMFSDWTSLGRLLGVHQDWINPWPFLMPVFVELIAIYIFIQPLMDVFLLLQREKRSQLQILDYLSSITVLMNTDWTNEPAVLWLDLHGAEAYAVLVAGRVRAVPERPE